MKTLDEQLLALRADAVTTWSAPEGGGGSREFFAARKACLAAWDQAIASVTAGDLSAAVSHLEAARYLADQEGGDAEERAALALLRS
jgi:hypothetical protein